MNFIAEFWLQNHMDGFGMLGLVAGLLSTVMRQRTHILIGSMLCCAFYALHFWIHGAYSAVAMDVIALVQCLASIHFITPDRRPPWLTLAFIGCMLTVITATALTWSGLPSACVALGTVFATVARLQKRAQPMRWLYLGSTFCWMGHNLLLDMPVAYLCDFFAVAGFVYSIGRESSPARWAQVFIDYLSAGVHTTKVFRK